ncbi:MAG TPA: arginase [Geothermobacteraceae bacterium]|nr:arginase [Geothermobacteraceae bacterium]
MTAGETKWIIEVVGVPIDLGQTQRGVDLGPGALRYAGLRRQLRQLGYELIDRGNLDVPVRDSLPERRQSNDLPAIRDICSAVYASARRTCELGHRAVFLGGDHSIAIGTVGGITHTESVGLIYLDAHGDFNTPETSPSGNIHGMPLATLLGAGHPELVDIGRPGPKLKPEDVVLIGLRELDEGEKQRLKESGMQIYTMREIDERGIHTVTREALQQLGTHKRLHVSLDLDVLDPAEAPGVGSAAPGGLSYREAQLLCELIADTGRLSSVDLVEINPILDEHNRTSTLAVALTASLFGKSIL